MGTDLVSCNRDALAATLLHLGRFPGDADARVGEPDGRWRQWRRDPLLLLVSHHRVVFVRLQGQSGSLKTK